MVQSYALFRIPASIFAFLSLADSAKGLEKSIRGTGEGAPRELLMVFGWLAVATVSGAMASVSGAMVPMGRGMTSANWVVAPMSGVMASVSGVVATVFRNVVIDGPTGVRSFAMMSGGLWLQTMAWAAIIA